MKNPWTIFPHLAVRCGFFEWMNDEIYLKALFRARMGYRLNLKNPKTFSEKLQWLKLYDRNPEYTKMVDKYEVKKYVADRIGRQYIIPTLGVWERFEDIDFEGLPDKFVLKCTHDSGGLVIVRDKEKFDKDKAKRKINKSLQRNYYLYAREWPYKNVHPRIIAESYMEDDKTQELHDYKFISELCYRHTNSLMDYKFFCFNGNPQFLYISKGLEEHSTAKMQFMDLDWKKTPFQRTDFKQFDEIPPKPILFDDMKRIAECLASSIPFVRVDMYVIKGQIYFSELTFSPCSGFIKFHENRHDFNIGDLLELNNCK